MKRPSFPMSDVRIANLGVIASSLGCGGWRAMLRMIADGELVVSRAGEKAAVVIPAGPSVPNLEPAWNAVMAKGGFVVDRGDGTFVDTEEFDKPVQQKKVPQAVEAFAGIFGMKAEPAPAVNVEAMKNATKEQKIQAALAAMGSAIKKGSEL